MIPVYTAFNRHMDGYSLIDSDFYEAKNIIFMVYITNEITNQIMGTKTKLIFKFLCSKTLFFRQLKEN